MITIQTISRSGNPLARVRLGIMLDRVPLLTDGYTYSDGYVRFTVLGKARRLCRMALRCSRILIEQLSFRDSRAREPLASPPNASVLPTGWLKIRLVSLKWRPRVVLCAD